MLFAWAQDEEEGALIQNLAYDKYFEIQKEGWSNYGYLSPIGTAISIPGATHLLFNEDGAVINFKLNGKTYYGVHSASTQNFLGYLSEDHKNILAEHQVVTVEFESEFNQKKFKNIEYSPQDKTIIAVAKKKYQDAYLDCIQKAIWQNQTQANAYTGTASPPFIPDDAIKIDWQGSQCANLEEDGVKEGVGVDVYFTLINEITDEQKPELIEFANYLTDLLKNKRFAFYGHGLENFYMSGSFNSEALKYFRDNKVYNKTEFEKKFPNQITKARDYDYVFSTKDLWAGIPDGYNANTLDYVAQDKGETKPYEYSFADLKVREKYRGSTIIYTGITNREAERHAAPLATHEAYDQYFALFETNSAIYAWTQFFFEDASDVMEVGVAYEAVRVGAKIFRASTKSAKGGFVKKLAEYLKKLFKSDVIDNLVNKIDDLPLQNLAKALRSSDNLILKESDEVAGRLSVYGWVDNDFKELAHFEGNSLIIKESSFTDNISSNASISEIASDVKIKSSVGDDLSGKIELVTEEDGSSWFRIAYGNYATSIDDLVTETSKVDLPGSISSTFTDGVYRTVVTNSKITLYRSFGDEAYLKGGFATTKAGATRSEVALLDEWNNSMRFEATIEIPAGQRLNIGKVAPQTSSDGLQKLSGGGDQILMPQTWNPESWVKNVIDTETGKTYTFSEFKEAFPDIIIR